jgi:hypothetical protein
MDLKRAAMGITWVSLLSGCMMGGMAHPGGMGGVGPRETGQALGPLQYAEASSGDLTIALSFPTPSSGAMVAMDARLTTASDPHELINGKIWLRIQTPSGSLDELRMQRLHSSAGATYQATYNFRTPGFYLVTAEGSIETDANVRTASVTTRVPVSGEVHADRHDWLMPMAVLGGLGMVVMMVVMMGS